MAPALVCPPVERPWTVGEFILIWLGGLVGTLVFGIASLAIGDRDLLVLLGLAGQYVGNLGVFWWMVRSRPHQDIGLDVRGGDFAYIGIGILFQVAVAVMFLPLSDLLFPDGRPPQEVADLISDASSLVLKVGLVLAAVLLAPVTEEILFRGVLFNALRKRGDRFAMVVSSLVFAAAHALGLDVERMWQSALVVLPPIFALGMILAWVTRRSGRLGPAIMLHSGWNLLASLVLLIPSDLLQRVG